MDIDWPADIEPYRWEFYLQPNTRVFRSPITRTRQVLEGQGPRYVGVASIRLGTRTTVGRRRAQRFEAFLDKLKGQVNATNVWDFAVCGGPLGPNLDRLSITGLTQFIDDDLSLWPFTDGNSPETLTYFSGGTGGRRVHGMWAIGSEQVLVDGFPGGTTQLYAGDGVQLGRFLYRLTEDALADGMGRAYLQLNRALIEAVAHDTVPILDRPRTRMQLTDDDQARRNVDIGGIREYSVSMIEAFF